MRRSTVASFLPDTLVESEFTGARSGRRDVFAELSGRTLLLDEVGAATPDGHGAKCAPIAIQVERHGVRRLDDLVRSRHQQQPGAELPTRQRESMIARILRDDH